MFDNYVHSTLTNLAVGSASYDDTSENTRIVGGDDADIGKYPFFVGWEGCGAALIHDGEFRNLKPIKFTSFLNPDLPA